MRQGTVRISDPGAAGRDNGFLDTEIRGRDRETFGDRPLNLDTSGLRRRGGIRTTPTVDSPPPERPIPRSFSLPSRSEPGSGRGLEPKATSGPYRRKPSEKQDGTASTSSFG